MADREKVIKGLECCGKGNMCRSHCPYDGPEDDIVNCTSQLARDALSLLKEQQSAYERGKRDGVSQYLREREEDEEYEY